MRNVAVFYHREDLDGVMSGVIANYYLSKRVETLDLIPINYKEDFIKALPNPADFYDTIFVIDVSDFKLFKELGHKIVWIDHHKVIDDKDFPPVKDRHCMIGVAACRLAFRYFTDINYHFDTLEYYVKRKNMFEPWCVALAGEFDIWDKTSPLAERFNFGVIDLSFDKVDNLFRLTKGIYVPSLKSQDTGFLKDNKNTIENTRDFSYLHYIIEKGEGALEYIRDTDRRCKGVPVTVEYLDDDKNTKVAKGVAFNTHVKSSLIHNLKPDEDFTLAWNYQGGDFVKASFYSDKIDVSNIAKRFGGGGHAGAAGCTIEVVELVKIISDSNK